MIHQLRDDLKHWPHPKRHYGFGIGLNDLKQCLNMCSETVFTIKNYYMNVTVSLY